MLHPGEKFNIELRKGLLMVIDGYLLIFVADH